MLNVPNHINISELKTSKINIDNLNQNKWRLISSIHKNNLKILENEGTPLGHICSIKTGFATLKDSVFLIDHETADRLEPGILKTAIKIAEINEQSEIDEKIRKIIYPYKIINNKLSIISEKDLKNNYPKAYNYLLAKKELLLQRSCFKNNKLMPFYAWGRIQSMTAEGPKLLTKTFNKKPQFFYDKTDSLFCNGYSLSLIQNEFNFNDLTLEVLCKLLNSSVLDYYLKLTSFQISGDYQCFQKNFLEKFCIPKIDSTESKKLLRLEGVNLENKIYDLFNINGEEVRSYLINRAF